MGQICLSTVLLVKENLAIFPSISLVSSVISFGKNSCKVSILERIRKTSIFTLLMRAHDATMKNLIQLMGNSYENLDTQTIKNMKRIQLVGQIIRLP